MTLPLGPSPFLPSALRINSDLYLPSELNINIAAFSFPRILFADCLLETKNNESGGAIVCGQKKILITKLCDLPLAPFFYSFFLNYLFFKHPSSTLTHWQINSLSQSFDFCRSLLPHGGNLLFKCRTFMVKSGYARLCRLYGYLIVIIKDSSAELQMSVLANLQFT